MQCHVFCVWALGLQMDECGSDSFGRQLQVFPCVILCASVCPFLFFAFLSIPTPHVSVPFIFPACSLSVCFLSTRLFVCQPVSQTGIPEQKAAAALGPIYSSSIHLSLPLSPGFVLFSAAINLLANRLQSRRLGVGIMFLALRPPKNAGA